MILYFTARGYIFQRDKRYKQIDSWRDSTALKLHPVLGLESGKVDAFPGEQTNISSLMILKVSIRIFYKSISDL